MAQSDSDKLNDLIDAVKSLQGSAAKETDIAIRTEQLDKVKKKLVEAKELLEKIQAAHGDANGELAKQVKLVDTNQRNFAKILALNKGITSTIRDSATETKKFLTSVDQWFNKSQEIAGHYLQISKGASLTTNQTKILAKNFNDSVKESMRLGVSLDKMEDIYAGFNDETGRARTLAKDEALDIAKLVGGLDMFSSDAVKLAESFDLMGISSEGMINHMDDILMTSSKMGINSNKVVKTLQTNMKSMQNYSFKSGVKGMVEMSKLAVKMRMDVGAMLGLADKFYNPEGAIETAANLQLLGGEVAAAFGDPIKLMYEARNAPEELMERIGGMTSKMVQFNKVTGEFDMGPEAVDHIRIISQELNMSRDTMTQMTRQAAKIRAIKIDVNGSINDPETREAIAGMARMKDGKWQVDVVDKNGVVQTKAISDLDKTMAEDLLSRESDKKGMTEKDLLSQIALNTMTFSKRVENETSSQQYGFAAEVDVYGAAMEGFLDKSIDNISLHMDHLFGSLKEAVGGKDGIGSVLKDAFGVENDESIIDRAAGSMMQQLTSSIGNNLNNGVFDVNTMTTEAGTVQLNVDGITGAQDLKIKNNSTVVMGKAGAFKLDANDSYGVGKNGDFTAGTNLFDGGIGTPQKSEVNSSVTHNHTFNGNISVTSADGGSMQLSLDDPKIKEAFSDLIVGYLNGSAHNSGMQGSSLRTSV